jgi:hypothetical protein
MLDQLLSLLALLVIGLAAYGLGCPVLRGLGVGQEDAVSDLVWGISVGLVVAGTALAGLGLLGGLYMPLIGVLTCVAGLWGLGEVLFGWASHYEEKPEDDEPLSDQLEPELTSVAPPARWLLGGVLGLAALAVLGALVAALAPPTAGDALCYHLELPKTFLVDHAIRYLPDHDNSTFPLLAEMWYLWGLAIEGPVTAQLIHWGVGVLLGLATVVVATPVVGRPWAWIAGAVVILVPSITNQMTAPLNDLPLALFATLALAAWWRAVVNDESRQWFVLAGLAAGGALGTKYLALFFAAAVGVVSLWMFVRQPGRRRLLIEGLAIVAIVGTSTSGLWYLRSAWYRGNPVYPFLTEAFVQRHPSAPPITLPENKAPLGRNPLGVAAAAWQVSIHPERAGGRGHQLGILFLAVLPGLAFARRLRGLGTLLAIAGAYWILWYLMRQNVRFLLPIVPLLAVGVVWVCIELRRFPTLPRAIAGLLVVTILAVNALAAAARCSDQLAVACGLEDRDDYLLRHEPTWQAAQIANRIGNPDAHLLSQDFRAYYFQCRVTRENAYRRRTQYDHQLHDPAELCRTLRRDGFTHLLLAENVGQQGIQFDDTLSRLVDAQRPSDAEASLIKLAEYQFPDCDGGLRRYRLVMLKGNAECKMQNAE